MLKIWKAIALLLFVCLGDQEIAHAQLLDYHYLHFTQKDGLPSNTVYSITQDKDGYIWIGTDAGVTKFDGINFKTYTVEDGLPSNEVIHMFCDSKNRVWLSTMSKRIVYIEKERIITNKSDTILDDIYIQSPTFFYERGNRENFFIVPAYPAGFLYEVTKNRIKYYRSYLMNPTYRVFIKNNDLITITNKGIEKNKKGILYPTNYSNKSKTLRDIIYYKEKFIKIDNNQNISIDSFKNNHFNENYQISFIDKILYCYNDSNILIRTPKGIINFNILKNKIQYTLLKDYASSYVEIDNKNKIWISTLDNGIFYFYNLINKSSSSRNNDTKYNFHSILKSKNIIFLGNRRGKIFTYNKDNSTVLDEICYIERKENTSNRVLKITNSKGNILQISCDAGIYKFSINSKTLDKQPPIASFKNHFDIKNCIIFLTNGLYILKNNQYSKIFKNRINSRFYSAVEHKNNIILGSENGLHTFDFDSIRDYNIDIPIKTRVTDLISYHGQLFASTIDDGVYQIQQNKVINHYYNKNGLSSNTCNKIKIYKEKLFVATKKGISILNLNNFQFNYIYEPDGLASNTVNDFVVDNDTLIAATEKGVSFIDLKSIQEQPKPIYFINPIYIKTDTFWDAPKIIAHKDEVIQINLNSISFNTESKMSHYYRIKELDTAWTYTIDHNLEIKNLEPGKYTLQSYATNSYNVKSDLILLQIEIEPYFYQNIHIKFIAVIIVLFLFLLLTKSRLISSKLREQNRQEEINKNTILELTAWRSKINPHFVFNSLNTIQSLFDQKDYKRARDFIGSFSTILRKTIDSSNSLFVSIEEEIEYQKNYLELEKLKRNNSFGYSISWDNPEILLRNIPSLILQPIVENSLKHGLQNQTHGFIYIHFTMEKENVLCSILDNGPGSHKLKSTTSKGLQLVKQKIVLIKNITGQQIEFSNQNKLDENNQIVGFQTKFKIPLFKDRL